MKTLITIHGINSAGQWQDDVEDIFSPHFEYVKVKYKHYRRFGFFKMILEPWVLLLFGILVFYLWYFEKITTSVALLLLLILPLLAHISSGIRRWLALKSFKTQIASYMRFGGRPHVIAHSFGTYLTGKAWVRFEDIRTTHVVFTGCVIKRTWDWAGLLYRNPYVFRKIRNEVSGRDTLPRLANYAQTLIPELGNAGAVGFKEHPVWVHTVDSPNLPCNKCVLPQVAPIHNMLASASGHSDAFIDSNYAAVYWLPTLWDIDPKEYEDFLEMCLCAFEYDAMGARSKCRVVATELANTHWRWVGGRLKDYVRREIRMHPRFKSRAESMSTLVTLSIAGVWNTVAQACEAAKNKPVDWKLKARGLNPFIAVTNAVKTTLS